MDKHMMGHRYSDDGCLISAPFRFWRYPIWGTLQVPPWHQAVLRGAHGEIYVLAEGLQSVHHLPLGAYIGQYVDMRRLSLSLPIVHARSSDGWYVGLTARIMFRVWRPERVVWQQNPTLDLQEMAESVIREMVGEKTHDAVTGILGHSTEPQLPIADEILRRIRLPGRRLGIDVLQVLVLQVAGDKDRIKLARQIQWGRRVIAEKIALERRRRELEHEKAETEFQRVQDQSRVRLDENAAEEQMAAARRDCEMWEVERGLIPKQEGHRHEERMAAIGAYSQALAQLAEAAQMEPIGISSRRMGTEPVRNLTADVLGQGFADLKEMMGTAADSPTRLEATAGVQILPIDIILSHVRELAGIPGLSCTLTQEKNGGIRLDAALDSVKMRIVCPAEFPGVPAQIFVEEHGVPVLKPIEWNASERLGHIVLDVQSRYAARSA